MASMTFRKILKHSPDKIETFNESELKDDGEDKQPKWTKEMEEERLKSAPMSDECPEEAKAQLANKVTVEADMKQDKADALGELKDLLDFIEVYQEAAAFFDLNGSRDIYTKFRDL